MRKVVILLGGLFLLSACSEPAGPVIHNSGDGNAFNVIGDESSENDVTTPAPVIVQPVVVVPEGEEPA